MGRAAVTDRALRYRANQAMPDDAPRVCFACGSPDVEVGHLDGHEENNAPENLAYTCRACNVLCGNTLRAGGAGRLTNQYNPAGARNAAHYRNAVDTLTGKSRAMSLRSAVETIQGTPHAKRAGYITGKSNPGADTLGEYMAAVAEHSPGRHDRGGRVIHETPKARRSRFAREIARIKKERYGSSMRQNPDDSSVHSPTSTSSEVESPTRTRTEVRSPTSTSTSTRARANFTATVTGGAGAGANTTVNIHPDRRNPKRNPPGSDTGSEDGDTMAISGEHIARQNPRNPAAGSRSAFERFHGFPSKSKTIVERKVREHEHVAAIGELLELWIVPLDQETPEGKKDRCIVLKNFDGAWLSQSEDEDRPQLFIDGGDQTLDDDTLAECGVDLDAIHEVEVLGKGVQVTYYTDKTHLGKQGGKADYTHPFGETLDENDNRVFTGKASRPVIAYDTVNHMLFVIGGKYRIPPEGISN